MENKTTYYDVNLLRATTDDVNWYYSGQSSMIYDGKMRLESDTYASVYLSESFISESLIRSKKRKIIINTIDQSGVVGDRSAYSCWSYEQSNNIGSLSVDVTFLYRSDTTVENERVTFTCNNVSGKRDSITGVGVYEFELDMSPVDLAECKFTIRNNGSNSIYITKACMYRSQDVDQLAENVVTTMTVVGVKAYRDGMTVSFDNSAVPLKCWWLEGENGEFAGINVNNEKMISFKRVDELLE